MDCVFCGAIPCVCYLPNRESGNQDWNEWAEALEGLKHGHEQCDRCKKYLMSTLIYRYAQRTYITEFEGTSLIVEYDYRVCTDCLFDLISQRYLEGSNNG